MRSAIVAAVSQSANIIGTSDAARILGWSIAKVKREAKDGRLPFEAKLPGETGAYLFHRAVIEQRATHPDHLEAVTQSVNMRRAHLISNAIKERQA